MRLQQVEWFVDQQRYTGFLLITLDLLQDRPRIFRGIEAKENDVRSGIGERLNPSKRIGNHEMNLKGLARMLPQRANHIREKKHVLHVMTVCHIEMEAF